MPKTDSFEPAPEPTIEEMLDSLTEATVEEDNFGLPIQQAITIIVTEDGPFRVDLGSIPPHSAAMIFKKTLESLEDMILPPVITYNDEIIFDMTYEYDDEDDQV